MKFRDLDFDALEQRIYHNMCAEMRENHDPGDEQVLSFNEVVDAWATRQTQRVQDAERRVRTLDYPKS